MKKMFPALSLVLILSCASMFGYGRKASIAPAQTSRQYMQMQKGASERMSSEKMKEMSKMDDDDMDDDDDDMDDDDMS